MRNIGPCFRSIPGDIKFLGVKIKNEGFKKTWREQNDRIWNVAGKIFAFLALHASGIFLIKGAFMISPMIASGAGAIAIIGLIARKIMSASVHMGVALYLAKATVELSSRPA